MKDDIVDLRIELQNLKKDYESRFNNIEERLVYLEKEMSPVHEMERKNLAQKLKDEIAHLASEQKQLLEKKEFEQARNIKDKILKKQEQLKRDFKEFIHKLEKPDGDSVQSDTSETVIPIIPPISSESQKKVNEKPDIPKTSEAAFRDTSKKNKGDEKAAPQSSVSMNSSDVPTSKETEKKPKKETTAIAAEILAPLMAGPLGSLFSKVRDLYKHYKDDGKLPILFLTVAGIITLVLGFGFILQYSFTNFLNETAKVSIGFVASIGVVILGIKVIHIKEAYREYGSSLVGLGTILIYLCIYFAASFYKFIPSTVGFGLICLNTVVAYFLAIRYETKIVSIISFLGGAFVPFVLGSYGRTEVFYFSFLLILCGSTIHLGKKIKWPALVYISFLVAAAIIEYTIFGSNLTKDVIFLSILIHAFGYIYIYYSLFDSFTLRKDLKKEEMLILVGAVSLLLLNLFQIFQKPEIPGFLYAANSVPFFILALAPFVKPEARLRTIFFLIGGLFLGLAIPALFHFKLMALFWVQEAFLLLILGFLYKLVSVRREAFVVALIAIGQSLLNLPLIADHWNKDFFQWFLNAGMMNLFALGILLFLFSWALWKYDRELDSLEKKGRAVVNESVSLWTLVVFLMAAFYVFPQYGAAFAIIAMPLLFFRSKKKSLPFTRFLGFCTYGMLLVQAGISVYHLTDLLPKIYGSWDLTVFLNIVLHLAVVGSILIVSNIIFIKLKDSLEPVEKETKLLNNELISTWAFATFYLAAAYLLPEFIYFLILIPIPFLLLRASKKNLYVTKFFAFGAYGIFLYYAIAAAAFITKRMSTNGSSIEEIFSNKATIHLLLTGLCLGALIFIYKKFFEELKPLSKQTTWLNNELFSIWALGAFLFAAYYIHEPFMFGLAIIPMPFLLIRSFKVKLPLTQVIAFGCYILILVQCALSIESVGTLSFSKQTIYGKIAFGEAFLLLWVFQWFFQWLMPDHPLMKYMKKTRIFFYCAVPLLFVPHVAKYYFEFLPLVVWATILATIVLYEIVKEDILRKEVLFLSVIASFYTLSSALLLAGKTHPWQPVGGVLLGIVLLVALTLFKGGFKADQKDNTFSFLFKVTFIYLAAAAFSLTFYFTKSAQLALLVSGSYALIMFLFRDKLPPIMVHRKIYYRVGQSFIILGLIIDLVEGRSFSQTSLSISIIIPIVSFLILTFVTYFDKNIYTDISGGDEESTKQIFYIDLYLYHTVVLGLYMMIIKKLTGIWFGPATTVMLVAHAIVIMFYSTVKGIKKLIPFYVGLFVLAAAKIILYDLKDFSLFEKILAFTVIGIVMLASAYLMQRFISKDEG